MRVTLFDVVNLKRKSVCLIDHHSDLIVSKVLRVYYRAACIRGDRDGRLFDDADGIAKILNFASVVGIRNVFCNRSATEEFENFLAKNFRCKVTGWQVIMT